MFSSALRPAGERNGNGNGHSHGDVLLQADGLEAEFQRIKTGIHRELLDSLDLSRITGLSDEELRDDIRRLAEGMLRASSRKVPPIDEERLVEELIAESFGLGPLEPYLQDPDVTDILVNGPHEVYVERLGRLQETNTVFADEEHLLQIIQRIVARIGRRIDEHSPMVDARLPDGSRVNAIIPPLALHGPVLSIRRFGHRPLQINDLLVRGSVCPEILKTMEAVIEGRINVMVSGGTGSGKTTLLNNLSKFIPANERLVTIEDSAELLLQRKHVVKLETRPKSAEGTSEVSQRDLVRNALRMRPDRIILGEVRGGEALDMLQAMNTGHDGSMSTGHANSPRDMLSRLETMVLMAGVDLPVRAIREQVASAVDLIVQQSRLKDGTRRIVNITEVQGMEGDVIVMQDVFVFEQTGIVEGKIQGRLKATGIRPKFVEKFEVMGIHLPPGLFGFSY
jgi:pilus assembly protein CpaF